MKLVRDNIPDIIINAGKKPVFFRCSKEEKKVFLIRKLEEEIGEFILTPTAEELADILEVLDELVVVHCLDKNSVSEIKLKKRKKNGSFSEGVILEKVLDDETKS